MSRRAGLIHEAMQAGIKAARASVQFTTMDEVRKYLAKMLRISESDRDWEVCLEEFKKGYRA